MAISYTKNEIRSRYDAFAPKYDLAERLPEILGVKRLRTKLLSLAKDDVLEIAVGTGNNLPLYPAGCCITGVDLSSSMMNVAKDKSERNDLDVEFQEMDAEALSFPDDSFDTVVDTLSTCTFVDPVQALREMGRVCRPDGRILLLEHGRSDARWLARFQDWRSDSHAKPLGCVWNKEPLKLVDDAGLRVISNRRSFLGIFHTIVAAP